MEPEPPVLSLLLLGPMQIRVHGRPVELPAKKARAFLAYLALRGGLGVSRETVATLLWGERGEEQARASLRQTLLTVRKALGVAADTVLAAKADTLSLSLVASQTDVEQVMACAYTAASGELEAALALCRGELLEGLNVDEPAFDQWLAAEREAVRLHMTRLLSALTARHEADGRLDDAIGCISRLVRLEPLQETAHRKLMRLYLAQGRHDAALKQYGMLEAELQMQLGVAPERETAELARKIVQARRGSGAIVGGPRPNPSAAMSNMEPPPRIPDKPSIAILPFANLSADLEQEYFSDGITDDIITGLSRYSELFVIARNSSFAFRDRRAALNDVGERLGVRYLLEGSVRTAGNRIRITAQLVDAASLEHLWADRYDREIHDIFEIQDDVTRSIVSTLKARVDVDLVRQASAKPTSSLSAYECVLRGQQLVHRYQESAFAQSRELFKKAIALDPEYARAYGWLAYVDATDSLYWRASAADMGTAVRNGAKGLSFDGNDSRCHLALGVAYLFTRRYDRARHHFDRASLINPNDDLTMVERGRFRMYTGEPLSGADDVRRAMRQNPYHPNWYWNVLARCLHTAGDYQGAIAALLEMEDTPFWTHAYLAACYAQIGDMVHAVAHRALAMELKPDFSTVRFMELFPYRDATVLGEFFTGFSKAGFPD